MSESVLIDNALRLPAPDVEALIQGRMIGAMPRQFLDPGKKFALYPTNVSINLLPHEQHYGSNFLPIAQAVLANLGSETVLIKAWARCELCQMPNEPQSLEALSQLTVWTTELLQQTLLQRPHIFLAHLRVYLLSEPIEVPVDTQERRFVNLPQQLRVSEALPVLSDRTFTQRKHQLQHRLPPLHPELEELQSAIAFLLYENQAAEELDRDIKILLGWSSNKSVNRLDSDLLWIKKIAEIGNSSDGHYFEKLVRKSLIKLGFTNYSGNSKASLNPDGAGGAGGIDFYCEKPYQIVGECKASSNENVPNGVCAQLINLGVTNLGQEQYDRSIKLIVAAGALTNHALKCTVENKMNVIRPETLQSLVELQAHYKGAINLLDLKQYLQQAPFGLADDKVNSYIDKVHQDIKVRSQIVQAVKHLGESGNGHLTVEIRVQYNAVFAKELSFRLDEQLVHDLLVELASPLTGYLGRIKGSDWRSDRFYFLRDLPTS